MKIQRAGAVALSGALVAASLFVIPWPTARFAVYELAAVACVALIALGIRKHRPPHRAAWWAVAAGVGLNVVADVTSVVLDSVGRLVQPGPIDVVYLVGYAAVCVGLYLTVRRRDLQHIALLDSAIFTIAASSIAWATLAGPVLDDRELQLDEVLILAYPAVSITILVLALRLALGGGWKLPSQRYATVAVVCSLLADTVFTWLKLQGDYEVGNLIAVLWLVGYVAWAASATHPSMAALADPGPTARQAIMRSHVGLLVAAALTVPVVSVLREPRSATETAIVVAAGASLIVLCMLRLASVTAQARQAVEQEAAKAAAVERRLAALTRHATDVILVVGADGAVQYASPSVHRMLGWTPEEVVALPPLAVVHPEDRARTSDGAAWARARANRASASLSGEIRCRTKDGGWRHVEMIPTDLFDDPAVEGLVLNMRDVTERKALEDQLTHQAFHDSLTGLPNRLLFADRVEHALRRRPDGSVRSNVAVLFCDLDDFKAINDTFGHGEGDNVLKAVAASLSAAIRPGDTAARLGGDEFAILLEDIDDVDVELIAARVLDALVQHLDADGRRFSLSGSVGVATGEAGTASADGLMRDADAAMYAAKRAGKHRWSWFDPEMHASVAARLRLESELRTAVEESQFEVHYQPIIDLGTRAVTGAEALVRWNHPERGLVPPADFIAVAEETGLIVPMGWSVLADACRFAADQRQHTPTFAVSVNLSALQLAEPDLVARVAGALADADLPASGLVLELTESLVVSDSVPVLDRLEELRSFGVRIAIDDFGTGYSSLSYLQRLPVDVLKIDKSFVDRIGSPGTDLVPAILDVARALGLHTVAEGVEQADQAGHLSAMGCDRAQGYLFARPLPAEDFAQQWTMDRTAPALP